MTALTHRRSLFRAALAGAAAGTVPRLAFGQDKYPTKPLRVVVPFPPGGNADATGRIVADALSERLHQSAVIVNQGGAGGAIGATAVAQAPADGYTLLCATTGPILVAWQLAGASSTYKLADLKPLAMLTMVPYIFVVNASSSIQTFADLTASIKAKPQGLKCGHPGNGTTGHVDLLQLQQLLKAEFIIAPYRGAGPVVQDLLAGQLDLVSTDLPSVLQLIKAGRLRAIGTVSANRAESLPDVPTMNDLKMPEVNATTFSALLGPKNLPPAIAQKLTDTANAALDDPAVQKRFQDIGGIPTKMRPDQFEKYLAEQEAIYAGLIKSGLLTAQ